MPATIFFHLDNHHTFEKVPRIMGLKLLTHAEQVAAHLRSELLRGAWSGTMPGVLTLEAELGVNRNTMQAALMLLQDEGLLVSEGNGRPRRINLPDDFTPPSLRVKILPYEDTDRSWHVMLDLQHRLLDAGHSVGVASRTLLDMGMNVGRVARFVSLTEADAWVIISGPREVLEWFSQQPKPAFAIFGRRRQVPLASTGPDKLPAYQQALRRLLDLGHRRIVTLVREERRKPKPGMLEQALLDQLADAGIPTSIPYNLPDWAENPASFRKCLDSLFQHTPPTALLIDEFPLFVAAHMHLSQLGIQTPKHISMVCLDPNPTFAWCHPSIAHLHWDSSQIIRRVMKWINRVARGREDRSATFFNATFVEGGTIGPARGSA